MQIITTADGSHTLYLAEMNEQYHSLNGAITESEHVYIENGYKFHQSPNPVVFEIGFGTGLNCLLTALQAEKSNRQTLYITVEKFPIDKETWEQLNYGKCISEPAHKLFCKIHETEWNTETQITKYFRLYKLRCDIHELTTSALQKCDIVYFDAFGPEKQPDMWTPEVFNVVAGLCKTDAALVTYSAKGQVRRELQAAGFTMKRLPGPPGKNEMLRGIKQISNI
jgi:tRNA U34 5-methylaminomethyl-2-thiouridine-forming methyltransferase MnmC